MPAAGDEPCSGRLNCRDLDGGPGSWITDSNGETCTAYYYHALEYGDRSQCGNYDNANFKANTLCCACGGGSTGVGESGGRPFEPPAPLPLRAT